MGNSALYVATLYAYNIVIAFLHASSFCARALLFMSLTVSVFVYNLLFDKVRVVLNCGYSYTTTAT